MGHMAEKAWVCGGKIKERSAGHNGAMIQDENCPSLAHFVQPEKGHVVGRPLSFSWDARQGAQDIINEDFLHLKGLGFVMTFIGTKAVIFLVDGL